MKFLFLPQTVVFYILGGAGAAITLLYILKLRRRRVEVPFAALWKRVVVEKQTSALWRKLRRIISLLIALAVAALLAFAAGDPREVAQGEDGRTMVILIDSSASMRATGGEKDRLSQAKEAVKKILSDLGRNDHVMIVRFDSQVVPLTPFSQDERLLRKTVEEITTTDTRADVLRALSFAADALRGQSQPVVVVVSDGAFGPPILAEDLPPLGEAKLHFIQVKGGEENVGIVAFNARRLLFDRLAYELYLEVKNYGQKAQEVDLTLYLGERPFDIQRVILQPGATVSRFYTPDAIGVDAEESHLTARISYPSSQPDGFPADDVAYALIPKRQTVAVLIASDRNNFFLEGVFYGEGETLTVDRTSCAEATEEKANPYTVVIFDHCAPLWAKEAKGNFLYFDPPDTQGTPLSRAKNEVLLPKLTRLSRKHPLLRWVTFADTTVLAARPFTGVKGENAVIEVKEGPILVAQRTVVKGKEGAGGEEGRSGERRMIAVGFDLAQSDLPLRVAFPIFIQNMLTWFTDDDATYIANYQTGQTWYVPVKGAEEEALLIEPDGKERRVPIYDHRAIFTGKRSGFYKLQVGSEVIEVAANLADEVESKIATPEEIPLPGAIEGPPAGGGAVVKREIWITLILVVIGILLLEWWTYHRRLTV